MELQDTKIGALWEKISKKGTKYHSGLIEINGQKHKILMFKNNKKKDTHPDYNIHLAEDKLSN